MRFASILVALVVSSAFASGVSAGSLFDFLSSPRGPNDSKPNGLTLDQMRAELGKSNHLTSDQVENLLERALDYKGELFYGNTARDYMMLLHDNVRSCSIAALRRRILMHHGRDESKDAQPMTNIRINLTRFCRRQFYLLIDDCLDSMRGPFRRVMGDLYKKDREWESRQYEYYKSTTPMEEFILRHLPEN